MPLPSIAELTAGKLDHRLEAAITAGLDKVVTERAKELAGTRDAKMFRSKAIRDLLVRGAVAWLKDRQREQGKA